MTKQKADQLEELYNTFLELLKNNYPLEKAPQLFVSDIMGYGSNLDEKILNLKEFLEGVQIQRDQAVGLEIQFEATPVFRRISQDENVAIYVDEIKVMITIEGALNEIMLRLSMIFEFMRDIWMCTHFHSSTAVDVTGDAWQTDIWKKKNEELQRMVDERTTQLQKSILELRSTQAQLIQSEKMASLGELTAGIAHEIQNPLNFVNNFSEVNNELIEELISEKLKVKSEKSERDENLEEELLENIRENEKKINHHGKRAEAIVKSMLQHSRGAESGNKKEPTDINALADEYFRMAYHIYLSGLPVRQAGRQGFQSKQKDAIEIKLITDFDSNLPLVNVIPQDIGRVLLNIFNNAFWACAERGRWEIGNDRIKTEGVFSRSDPSGETPPVFVPLVTLTTKNLGDHIEIHIHDNGTGIPSNIIDKIFQPFYTTKPAGQGTGLGLSLSYDIVKSHEGNLTVNSTVSKGSEFIIQLPAISIK